MNYNFQIFLGVTMAKFIQYFGYVIAGLEAVYIAIKQIAGVA